ncbi:MAG: ECF transporter S component [Eubacteriales bacterium]|nr:ECF transporter S component [Clostridiales bacterium]MDY5836776.1 ECF transporter S component [Eubacteriales bacterium]
MAENLSKQLDQQRQRNLLIAQMAIMTALAYVGFQFLRFDLHIAGGRTSFHFGNVFVMLAGLLLGPVAGGFSSALGLTIADLTSGYGAEAPATLIIKWLMATLVYWVGESLLKLSQTKDRKAQTRKLIIATAAGAVYNVIFDTFFRYLYKRFIMGLPQDIAAAIAKLASVTTIVNGLLAMLAVTLVYLALVPTLDKNDWYHVKLAQRNKDSHAN